MINDRFRIHDILEAIEEIIQSMPETRAQFDADKFRRSHVLRYIQIIGEAASRLSAETRALNPNVPWKEIMGMRHILVHDYFDVNWQRVYDTAANDIPALKQPIQAIAEQMRPDPDITRHYAR
jgi:uncharacterized protein with HEPN domain